MDHPQPPPPAKEAPSRHSTQPGAAACPMAVSQTGGGYAHRRSTQPSERQQRATLLLLLLADRPECPVCLRFSCVSPATSSSAWSRQPSASATRKASAASGVPDRRPPHQNTHTHTPAVTPVPIVTDSIQPGFRQPAMGACTSWADRCGVSQLQQSTASSTVHTCQRAVCCLEGCIGPEP